MFILLFNYKTKKASFEYGFAKKSYTYLNNLYIKFNFLLAISFKVLYNVYKGGITAHYV